MGAPGTAPVWVFDWTAVFQGLVGLLAAALALVVLRASPRKPANQFFALFMALLGVNFAAGFFHEGYLLGGDAAGVRLTDRVMWQALLLDPAALLYFALLYPRRDPRLGRPGLVLALGLPALLFTGLHLAAPWLFAPPLPGAAEPAVGDAARALYRFPVILYMAAYYLAAFGLLLRNYLREESPILRDQRGLFALGLGVAVFPRIGLIPYLELPVELPLDALRLNRFLVQTATAMLPLLGAWAWARMATAERQTQVDRVFVAMAGMVLAIMSLWLLTTPLLSWVAGGSFVPKVVFGLRWVFFGAIVGYALLKYQVFDVELRTKRWTGRGAAVAALAAVALAVQHASAAALPGNLPLALAAAGGMVVLAAWPVRRGADRLAARVFPAAQPGDEAYLHACRVEVYWAHLEEALGRGEPDPAEARFLEQLRERLDISEREHQALEHLVRRRSGPGPHPPPGRASVMQALADAEHRPG